MSMTIRSTTGTFLGDPNGIFVDEETTIDGSTNTLTITGTFSYYGNAIPLNGSFSMPAPSSNIQYVSLQVDKTGNINLYNDTTGNCLLVISNNVLVLYSETIPANAVNDQSFSNATEPVLD